MTGLELVCYIKLNGNKKDLITTPIRKANCVVVFLTSVLFHTFAIVEK